MRIGRLMEAVDSNINRMAIARKAVGPRVAGRSSALKRKRMRLAQPEYDVLKHVRMRSKQDL